MAGLWTPAVSRFYLLSLPFVVLATLLGRAVNRRLEANRFLSYVHGGLIAIGLILLWQAISGWCSGSQISYCVRGSRRAGVAPRLFRADDKRNSGFRASRNARYS